MKKIKFLLVALLGLCISSCSDGYGNNNANGGYYYPELTYGNNDEYLEIEESGFIETVKENKSSFSLDVSTAAYSNIRDLINHEQEIPKSAVVIEQMLNYFKYDFPKPPVENDLAVFTDLNPCPWNEQSLLATIAVSSKDIDLTSAPVNNLVFLLDVSGSMSDYDKLPLLQSAFDMLLTNLKSNDIISIVTYASGVRVVADGLTGNNKLELSRRVNSLVASGSTNGAGGIQTAYELASKHFIEEGNNRVILATDGDFNVGISTTKELENFIAEKRTSGVYLSVLGFGRGNLKSNKMETLASKGNGNYHYIDSILEAKKVLVDELGGTLHTVAKDVKTQVVFNTNNVNKYRLIGYENKILTNEEFENDNTDAGEIGAGHVTLAMYELILNDNYDGEQFFDVNVKYKDVNTEEDKEIVSLNKTINLQMSDDIYFASLVVEFALILRDSSYKGNANLDSLIEKINNYITGDEYRMEFKMLVLKYHDYITKKGDF